MSFALMNRAVKCLALLSLLAPALGLCESGPAPAPSRAEPTEPLEIVYAEPPAPVAGKEIWLIVYGHGFSEDEANVQVFLNNLKAEEVRVPAPDRLKARFSEETKPGSAAITVRNPDGASATLTGAVYFRSKDGGYWFGAAMARMRHDWRVFCQWFSLGGPVMYPIALLSLFTVAWAVHSTLVLRRSEVMPASFVDALSRSLAQEDLRGAAAACERTRCVFGRVALAGLLKAGDTPEHIREAVNAAGAREAAHLHQKISYLANIGVLAPMLGLLGTVFGMIMAFSVISTGDVRHFLVAGALAHALVATAGGLIVGVPAMGLYFYLRGRLLGLTTQMEVTADEVASKVIEKGEGG